MFGGSALWGTGARDDHTIPSEVARLAEHDGQVWEVINYGESGYVIWQEAILLAQLCAAGNRPNAVVFYDGANDVFAKLESPAERQPIHNLNKWRDWYRLMQEPHVNVRFRSVAYEFYKRNSLVFACMRRLLIKGHLQAPHFVDAERFGVAQLAVAIVDEYAASCAFIRDLGRQYAFQVVVAWQPTLFNQSALPGDVSRLSESSTFDTKFYGEVYRRASQLIADREVLDLTRVICNPGMIFLDWVHIAESGNHIVAEKIYSALKSVADQHPEARVQ